MSKERDDVMLRFLDECFIDTYQTVMCRDASAITLSDITENTLLVADFNDIFALVEQKMGWTGYTDIFQHWDKSLYRVVSAHGVQLIEQKFKWVDINIDVSPAGRRYFGIPRDLDELHLEVDAFVLKHKLNLLLPDD